MAFCAKYLQIRLLASRKYTISLLQKRVFNCVYKIFDIYSFNVMQLIKVQHKRNSELANANKLTAATSGVRTINVIT
jgi:hypothetical protein